MKKLFFLCVGLSMMSFFMLPSCKKITHPTHPTPTNYRLSGYTVTTTPNILLPSPVLSQVVTATYAFYYDGNGKVSQVLYSTNDSNLVKINRGNQTSTFTYSGNTIYKTTTIVTANNIIERDTFTTNAFNQVTAAQFPGMVWAYSYYGQLLYHETFTSRDTGTTITGSSTYTSASGNFLKRTFNGQLSATFPDTGLRPVVIFPDTVLDSQLSLPLQVYWTTYGAGGATVTHNASGYSDNLTGYAEFPVSVYAEDNNHIRTRVDTLPGDLGAEKDYLFYSYQMVPGDYLQLGSFTTYGINIYQNATLVKQIKSAWYTTNVTYTIDADSKVTQMIATVTDRFGNVTTSVYNLSYATY